MRSTEWDSKHSSNQTLEMSPRDLQLKLSIVKCLERAEPFLHRSDDFLHHSDVCDSMPWSWAVFTGVYPLVVLSGRGPSVFLDR